MRHLIYITILGVFQVIILLIMSITPAQDKGWGGMLLPEVTGCGAPDGDDLAVIQEMVPALGGGIDYVITNTGSTYFINGVPQPTLTVERGQAYVFSISVDASHPFYVKETLFGANYSGFSIQGQTSGTHTLTIPANEILNEIFYICGVHGASMSGTINIIDPAPLLLSPKVFLDGPYNGSGSMNDDLRAGGYIPLSEPYTDLGYAYMGSNDGTIDPSVLAITGNNAIVDWVVVELRQNGASENIAASRSALVQRDGDVVSTDGISPVSISGLSGGSYHVAIRHRNHLAAMTALAIELDATTTMVDLTSAATPTFGTEARKDVGGTMVLWSGDVNFDGTLKYSGTSNDRDLILQSIGGVVPTNTIQGYFSMDVDLDGTVRYTGNGNDRDRILQNINGIIPTSIRVQQLP